MQIKHPCVKGSFKLIEVYEYDVDFTDDVFSLRMELFQSLSKKNLFRCKIWRDEYFRIQSTFPQDENGGGPLHEPSDELILIRPMLPHIDTIEEFHANNADEALDKILTAIGKSLEHITSIKAEIK